MTRIILSSLAFAALLSAGGISPAPAGESLSGGQQTTSCDCSNCSGQHCGGGPLEEIAFNYGKVTDSGRNPSGPNVVYVGGSRHAPESAAIKAE